MGKLVIFVAAALSLPSTCSIFVAADEPAAKRTEELHEQIRKSALASTPNLRALGFDLVSYPRVDGSTSTQPLAALVACRYFGLDYGWVGSQQRFPEWRGHTGRGEAEFRLLEYTL